MIGVTRWSGRLPAGLLPRVSPRQPWLVVASEFDGYLGAGVAGAHHQHSPFLDLGWVAVLLGVELDDVLVELACERRHFGVVIGARSHDHVLGEQRVLATDHFESCPAPGDFVDSYARSHRELQLAGISLEIVGGLVLGRIRRGQSRKVHPRWSVVTARREQP